jgi:DHA1 family multidrug resistance protein-like MFS transporter
MDDQDHYTEKETRRDTSLSHTPQTHTPTPDDADEKPHGGITRTYTPSATATSSSSTPDDTPAPKPALAPPRDIENLQQNNTASLSRMHTQRSQHSLTVGTGLGMLRSKSSARSKPLPEFGTRKPYPPPLPSQEDYVVDFVGDDDVLHAMNWPFRKKFATGFMLVGDVLFFFLLLLLLMEGGASEIV